MLGPRQFHLPLALPVAYGRGDFIPSPGNAQALAAIGQTSWPGGKLLLSGPEGSGKTHLLHIWCAEHDAPVLRPADLRPADPGAYGPGAYGPGTADLPDLCATGRVALDDADHVAQDPHLEAALFHLHNLLHAQGGMLLLAARTPVRDWGLCLPDLKSRLQAAGHIALAAPDDALLAAVLRKHFADRQVSISETLVPYLLTRMERSLAAAGRLVAQLDAVALAQGRPITRALAAEILQHTGTGPEGADQENPD